jgi:hypothetical protein
MAVTETAAPRRIESTLLVAQTFTDSTGAEWRSGDRAPLYLREIRVLARERPDLFRMEIETVPVDLEWLDEVDRRYEATYEAAKRGRDQEEERRERALRDELEAQSHPSGSQKQLERRYARQESERVEREKAAREEVARRRLESEVESALVFADVRDGFHFNNNVGGET